MHGPTIDDALNKLHEMQQSDQEFLRGLSSIGEDIERLDMLVTSVRSDIEAAKKELTFPRPKISQPQYRARYPIFDNELWFGLLNVGGGSITVPEIQLVNESWKPEITVDYTIPAAPPVILRLKVRLSPQTQFYPLLELNNEPHRRFGPFSEGAEDVCIQMSSDANAQYHVRIRIPYKDLSTDVQGELVYPPADKDALPVAFVYAPGWTDNITPENMIERDKVLSEMLTTFHKATMILERGTPSKDRNAIDELNGELRELRLYMGVCRYPGLLQVLSKFTPSIARIAQLENRSDALVVLLKLAHQLARYEEPEQFSRDHPSVKLLCGMADRPGLSSEVEQFLAETVESNRKKMLNRILAAL